MISMYSKYVFVFFEFYLHKNMRGTFGEDCKPWFSAQTFYVLRITKIICKLSHTMLLVREYRKLLLRLMANIFMENGQIGAKCSGELFRIN